MIFTLIVFPQMIFAQPAAPEIIESVSPAFAAQGESNVTITVTLADLGTPPVPPSHVQPSSIQIGSVTGSNLQRNDRIITAVFSFPATESAGQKEIRLSFPGPNNQTLIFVQSDLFEIQSDGGGIDPTPDPITPPTDTNVDYVVVDTGQEKYFNNDSEISAPSAGQAFYGQDALYQGIQPAYQDNGDGTVTDLNTGLMWQQSLPPDKYTYSESVTYANNSTLAGYTDWRLPTIKELYSLILFSGVTGMSELSSIPYLDTDYFDFRFGGAVNANERHIDAQYATSSIYTGTTMGGNETMFGVNMVDGRIKGYPTNKDFEVKLVRGDLYGGNDFTDNQDGTITDQATGLMWDQSGSSDGMNWEDALAWVHQLNGENYLGYSDWRLPNAKELQSIVDYERSPSSTNSAAISPVFHVPAITDEKGDQNYPFYWTSTTHEDGPWPNKAAYVCFGEALGYMNNQWIDVHGAGAQRSDPKSGDPSQYPTGFGPQGDCIRIFNFVRPVRNAAIEETDDDGGDDDTTGTRDSGATLFAPIGSTTTYLMDENNEFINTWESDSRPGLSAYLLEDKSLLRTGSLGPQGNSSFGQTGGSGGRVERFDWEGNKIWEFEYSSDEYLSHHDVEYLPNGNILMIAWEKKTQAEAVAAGRNPTLLTDGELWPDKIIEIEPQGSNGGNIVWEWHVWDHVVQDYDPSKPNYGTVADHPEKIDLNFVQGPAGADWTHINAVDYHAGLDQILLTVHNFSEIWIIDHNTTTAQAAGEAGDLLYRWGNPQTYDRGSNSDQQLFVPHDGRWIPAEYPGEDDILIFNNGRARSDGNYSTVDQITPPESGKAYTLVNGTAFGPTAPNWTYKADPPSSFYADHISGAQRLSNGNTLICDGPAGIFFEVTTTGETVWQYVNPYSSTGPQGESNSVFRAVRYDLDNLGQDDPPVDDPEPIATGDLTYPIVDTGQENCYNNINEISPPQKGEAFYGQDGQIDGNQPQYTISQDGLTVYDHVTGLTWTRDADLDGDGDIDADDKRVQSEGQSVADELNSQNFSGYSDWRVPTIKELYSLIDYRGTDPTSDDLNGLVPFIDTDYFIFGYGDLNAGDRIIDSQWITSSLYVGTVMQNMQAMFGVNFADGRIKGYGLGNPMGGEKTFYVRLCRGNPDYGKNNLSDNGDGTVTDAATGLMWTQDDNGSGVNWEDALAYAQQMNDQNYLGHNDWRLPNAKELHSILDYSRSPSTTNSAAIDPVFNATQITNEAGQADYPYYWSSTTFLRGVQGDARPAVYIAFGRGLGSMDGTTIIDVHGAGCQRSDPKDGNPSNYPVWGHGGQGDVQRVFNFVRLVRDASSESTPVQTETEKVETPQTFSLDQNYPNPFNPTTTIRFTLSVASNVEVSVYNLQGRRVKSLVSGVRQAGSYEVLWDATNEYGQRVASGLYLCQIIVGNQRAVRRMSLMK